MTIEATSGAGAAANATAASPYGRAASLGQDAFLRLLLTQLQHQDPTKPMQDTEFIAQLAQFSQLEKLTEISTAVTTMAAAFTALAPTSEPTT